MGDAALAAEGSPTAADGGGSSRLGARGVSELVTDPGAAGEGQRIEQEREAR